MGHAFITGGGGRTGDLGGTSLHSRTRAHQLKAPQLPAPQHAPQLPVIIVKKGQDITFEWEATCEENATWKKGGKTLCKSERITETRNKKQYYLTICNAKEEDKGQYTLELSESVQQVLCFAKVKVLDTQLKAPELQDFSVKRGQAITFEWDTNCEVNCEVKGKWKKDGLMLHNDGRINITEQKKERCFNLTIPDATDEDEGEYSLELSTWYGLVSGSAKVKLQDYAVAWRKIDCQKNDKVKTALREFRPSNPEAQRLRFLLHGPVGAGKSSIINSINTVFQGRIKVNVHAPPGTDTTETKNYKTYKIENQQGNELSFVFNDLMGLERKENSGVLPHDIISAIKGHIIDGYEFNPTSPLTGGRYYNSDPTLEDKVHCLVRVIPADKILCKDVQDDFVIWKMKEVIDDVKLHELPRVVLMTLDVDSCPLVKEDLGQIYYSKEIKMAMLECSKRFGVPMTCIYPVKNYHEENCEDEKIDCLILDALNTIVNFANDYVKEQIK